MGQSWTKSMDNCSKNQALTADDVDYSLGTDVIDIPVVVKEVVQILICVP